MNKPMNMKTLDALLKRVLDYKLEFIEFNGIKIQKSNHNYSGIKLGSGEKVLDITEKTLTPEEYEAEYNKILFNED